MKRESSCRIPTFFWEYKGHKPPCHDLTEYRLSINGEVQRKGAFTLSELESTFLRVEREQPMYCVNSWRMVRLWSGFRLAHLLEWAKPKPNAPFLRATSLGGYEDTTAIMELLVGDPLLVTHIDGDPLSPERGRPIRLLLPHLYQFKWVKALSSLDIVTQYRPGTWQRVGYTDATILNEPHFDIDSREKVKPEADLFNKSDGTVTVHSLGAQRSEKLIEID
jgi:DMSO/TMAO reductase YedYZ molybdopterin-dependent catalytic subunit